MATWGKIDMLHRALQLVAGLVIVALIAQPLAACVTPGQTMTAAEHTCCMKMASMCNISAMPRSHSCCKRTVSPQMIVLAKFQSGDLVAPAVLVLAFAPALPKMVQPRDLYQADSPPGSPPKLSTVLRI